MEGDSRPPSLEKTELQGPQLPSVSRYNPSQAAPSSSFSTAQSSCSIIQLVETQPRRALLCRGLTELTERAARQLAREAGAGDSPEQPLRAARLPKALIRQMLFQEEYPNIKLPSRVPKIPNLYLYLIQGKAQRYQQPGAEGTKLRRGGSWAPGTHFILSASVSGSCARKNRSVRLGSGPLASCSLPPPPKPQRGSCLQHTCLAQVGCRAPQRWRPSSNFWTSRDYPRPCRQTPTLPFPTPAPSPLSPRGHATSPCARQPLSCSLGS